jgi:branched-chain amino acid aminotransferase
MIAFNGVLYPSETALYSAWERGLLLGDGVFETIWAIGGQLWHWDWHGERLQASAAVLKFSLPMLAVLQNELLAVLAAQPDPLAAHLLRLTVTRGNAARGLLPPEMPDINRAIIASPAPPLAPPVRLQQSTIRRNSSSPLTAIKSLAYMDNMLALQMVRAAGADEAVLLNTADQVACTSTANLFVWQAGCLLTPPAGNGVLAGITRRAVLALAEILGLCIKIVPLQATDLSSAQAVFLTNVAFGMRFATSFEQVSYPDPPAVLQLLRQRLELSRNHPLSPISFTPDIG